MKNLKYFFPLLLILMTSSCKVELFDCLKAEGDAESRIVEFSEITALDIEIPVNIELTESEVQQVEIIAPPNIIDRLLEDSKMDGETWKIDIDGCVNVDQIEIKLSLRTIKNIKVDAVLDLETNGIFENIEDLRIEIDGVADLDLELGSINKFDFEVDGVSDIKVTGATNEQHIEVTGTAAIKNLNFESNTTNLEIDGFGNCEIWAIDHISGELDGSGKVCIKGIPSRDIEIDGSFDIENCN